MLTKMATDTIKTEGQSNDFLQFIAPS